MFHASSEVGLAQKKLKITMSVQYYATVGWDTTLIDIETTDTENSVAPGLVQSAVKITTGAPTATVGYFMPGAIIQNAVDGTTYINGGTTALPVFIPTNDAITVPVTVSRITTGTTPVNVLAATNPFAGTIRSIYINSLDTTAGNIVIKTTAGTVATIAKGTTAGALVSSGTLANTSFTKGGILTIESSTAGNAAVFITYVRS